MEKMKIKVGILPNQFLKENGTFNKKEAIKLCFISPLFNSFMVLT